MNSATAFVIASIFGNFTLFLIEILTRVSTAFNRVLVVYEWYIYHSVVVVEERLVLEVVPLD